MVKNVVGYFDPLINIEITWYKTFALLPHRTIGGKWIWLRSCYKRRVWRGDDAHIEPFTEYGDLFDILANADGCRINETQI